MLSASIEPVERRFVRGKGTCRDGMMLSRKDEKRSNALGNVNSEEFGD